MVAFIQNLSSEKNSFSKEWEQIIAEAIFETDLYEFK